MTDTTPPQPVPPLTSNLTCQQVTDAIIDYVNADMDPVSARTFEAHLRDCPDCTAFLNTYRGTTRALRMLRYEDVPDEMRQRVYRFLREKIQASPPPHA